MLIVISGLPGVGKTTVARELARRLGGVHLRIDTIEHAIARSGETTRPIGEAGYLVGYALAEDHLRQGLTVLAECVNPLEITRQAWRDVAARAEVPVTECELVCSDEAAHRHRVATRTTDVRGLRLPTWNDVLAREYEPWQRGHVVVDTAGRTVDECVARLSEACAGVES